VIDAHLAGADPQPRQHLRAEGQHLGVGQQMGLPHDVGVTLVELAVPPLDQLGAIGAPDGLHLVAAKRERQVGILGNHPRQRNREVIPERQDIAPLVGERIDELLPLDAVLAEEDLHVFHRRCFERGEAVLAEDPP